MDSGKTHWREGEEENFPVKVTSRAEKEIKKLHAKERKLHEQR